MPIYEYQCKKCGEIFEVMQKMSDPPPKKHSCGSKRVERVMSQTSFVLKGSGWYLTDYANKDKEKGKKQEGKEDSKSSSSSKDSNKDSKESKSSSPKSSDSKGSASAA